MAKRNKKHEKRVKKLIVICLLSAIILTVSTYAWFIGMQTVSVNAFEVEIAGADGLLLSVDGKNFTETVTINKDTETYTGNTNKWTSLEPISTIGAMNKDTNGSRMIVYEKSSLTASGGGYRLLSEQLVNKDDLSTTDKVEEEANGYAVFDLFIKNMSGEKYYSGNNTNNEEAIYLTLDSSVLVGNSGVENTGIENSVRVAFAQIGRVQAPTTNELDDEHDAATIANIRGITCESESDKKITGICRNATIWEPNNTKHVENAISWYTKSCLKRTIDTEAKTDKFNGACNPIVDGQFYETYAVAKTIPESLAYPVDVYDGAEYNTSTNSVDAGYLNAVDTFTDSEKILSGTSRKEFMTLAPNSVTKVRVYVYIEGQDVDNYDFASLGKQISVNFGFTKERFTAEDIEYKENDDVDLDDDLYRNFYVTYENSGTVTIPNEYKDIVTFKDDTNTLAILKSIKKSFTIKDGEATVNVTRTVTEDGHINWEAKKAE